MDHSEYEQTLAALRAQLDGASFATAWAAGHALPLAQIIEQAHAFVAPL